MPGDFLGSLQLLCRKILNQGIYRKLCGTYDTPERKKGDFNERGINLSWFDVPLHKSKNLRIEGAK